jgi:hypothetical protein
LLRHSGLSDSPFGFVEGWQAHLAELAVSPGNRAQELTILAQKRLLHTKSVCHKPVV